MWAACSRASGLGGDGFWLLHVLAVVGAIGDGHGEVALVALGHCCLILDG
jgi:hypothetical protein